MKYPAVLLGGMADIRRVLVGQIFGFGASRNRILNLMSGQETDIWLNIMIGYLIWYPAGYQ